MICCRPALCDRICLIVLEMLKASCEETAEKMGDVKVRQRWWREVSRDRLSGSQEREIEVKSCCRRAKSDILSIDTKMQTGCDYKNMYYFFAEDHYWLIFYYHESYYKNATDYTD